MTRSRCFTLALLFALGSSACDVADAIAPDLAISADDPITSILASAASVDPNAPTAGGSLFDRLAGEIESFGGLYRNGHCSVAVVLTDMSEADHAIRVVKAALEPLRACETGIRVHPVQGTYTYIELQRFAANARDLSRIDGVRDVSISYQLNKLVVLVSTRQVAKQVLDALPALNIPADAVTFAFSGGRGPTTRGPVSTPSSRG